MITKHIMKRLKYNVSLYKKTGNEYFIIECETLIVNAYNTRVGIADFETNTFYLFGYYSATTTQHAHKFIKWLKENYSRDFQLVRLEYYSNIPKRIANELVNCDYESLIDITL